jgi:hypothetical protein
MHEDWDWKGKEITKLAIDCNVVRRGIVDLYG